MGMVAGVFLRFGSICVRHPRRISIAAAAAFLAPGARSG
jgi:hypothetical protein